jgi:hypothetical protein
MNREQFLFNPARVHWNVGVLLDRFNRKRDIANPKEVLGREPV